MPPLPSHDIEPLCYPDSADDILHTNVTPFVLIITHIMTLRAGGGNVPCEHIPPPPGLSSYHIIIFLAAGGYRPDTILPGWVTM